MRPVSRYRLSFCLALLSLVAVSADGPERATSEALPRHFIRWLDDGDLEGRVETAVVEYGRSDGVRVTLVSAVHDADRSYFHELQGILESHGLLLYEGWTEDAESAADTPAGASRPGEITSAVVAWCNDRLFRLESSLYILLTEDLLGFRHAGQWDSIDYSKPSFVNVDMTHREWTRRAAEANEVWTLLQLSLEMVPECARKKWQELRSATWRDVRGLLDGLLRDWRQTLRYLFSREMVAANRLWESATVRTSASRNVTITERNELVMTALLARIRQGHRDLGIFYGAAHMPDFERRLHRLGFRATATRWVTAWDVRRQGDGE